MSQIDYKNPNYQAIYVERSERLVHIREHPEDLPLLRAYYRDHIPQFISDWGITVDPRVISQKRSAVMPFILFPKQVAWLEWLHAKWKASERGLTEKSRDTGVSWLSMAFSISMGLFHEDFTAGFGSATEVKLDLSGNPDTLFYKGRMFLEYLPIEFRGGWEVSKHAPYLRILIPETGSTVTGEAGDNIGRGGRKSIYFIDEAAHIEHPQLIDSALSGNTDCRQDVSSISLEGMANAFAQNRHSGLVDVFTIHWTDDPRKGPEWEKKKRAELIDPMIFEADYNINYTAATQGAVIPGEWVAAAFGAEEVLKEKREGLRLAALDVADAGRDRNAFAMRHGRVLTHVESWKGSVDLDIYHTVERAFLLCDVHNMTGFDYDADGLGAGVRGDARKVNEERRKHQQRTIAVNAFWGSGAVLFKEKLAPGTDRTNEDMFENRKAQAWWNLRHRFLATYRAVNGLEYNKDDVICIARDFPEVRKLIIELSQPIWGASKSGKILIEKQPDETPSPNLADAVMMCFAPRQATMIINASTLEASHHAPFIRPQQGNSFTQHRGDD